MNSSYHSLGVAASALLLVLLIPSARADENFRIDSLTVAYTNKAKLDAVYGTGTTDEKSTQFLYEHFGLNRWGYLYADLEFYKGRGIGAIPAYGNKGSDFDIYPVLIPSVSLAKVTGHSFTFGPISDVSIVARGVADSYYHYRAFGYGVGFHLAVPGFDWFETDFLTHNSNWSVDPATFGTNTGRDYQLDRNKMLWRTYIVSKTLVLGTQRFNSTVLGIVNGTGDHGNNSHGISTFIRADFTWQVLGHSDFQVGVRYQYSRHEDDPTISFGHNNYSASVPYLMFKYNL